jgi:thymidine kinase
LLFLAQGCDVVGIDEAQFFDDEIVKFVMICNQESSDCSWIRYGF